MKKTKITPEELDDQGSFRHLLTLSYDDLVPFILEYIGRRTWLTMAFWAFCLFLAGFAFVVRININGYYEIKRIILHSVLGFVVLPLLVVPLHELLHIIPYYLSGARDIRVGMDIRQYLFYVTAHRQVAGQGLFRLVAAMPFTVITIAALFLAFLLPGLWKWSISAFLFIHTTMCAGDFALLNFYLVNKGKKIFTWDDADLKEAYFFQEL